MNEIVATLPLNEEFLLALTEGQGICGEALNCCRAYESERIHDATFAGLGFDEIRSAYLEALHWSDDIVGELSSANRAQPQSQALSA